LAFTGWQRYPRSVCLPSPLNSVDVVDNYEGNRKMVNQFREALDQQSPALSAFPTSSINRSEGVRRTETISVKTGRRAFESWLKGIGNMGSLADTKRLRSDVTAQIRKANGQIGKPHSSLSFLDAKLTKETLCRRERVGGHGRRGQSCGMDRLYRKTELCETQDRQTNRSSGWE